MSKGLRKGLTSYGDAGFSLFLRKAFIKAAGYSDDALERPIVGITDTYSDYNPCHGNVPQLVEAVKRGVMLAGAMPMVFPTISIHESFAHPTSMYLRNLMAMDTEEMIRAQPMDAVVVIGGCDKTLPAQIMAAASVDLPTIVVPVGPMVVGHHKGEVLGACTDCRRLWAAHRAGEIDEEEIGVVSGRLAPSVGTCMVMGTASTMACITEGARHVAADERDRAGPACRAHPHCRGEREARRRDGDRRRPASVRDPHRLRVPERADRAASDRRLDERPHPPDRHRQPYRRSGSTSRPSTGSAARCPVLIDLKPSGQHYMEHFHHAGGVPKLMRELGDMLDLDAPYGGRRHPAR
jgi:dihydroxy-acid dehydratase